MAFREKTAWLTLVAMLVTYGVYFTHVAGITKAAPINLVQMLIWFGGATVVQVIVVVIGSIILAVTATGEAQAPADERDRAIYRRSASIAYYVLMVGMILVGVVMPFNNAAWKIINTALFALVVAETIRQSIVILSYRRGWHG